MEAFVGALAPNDPHQTARDPIVRSFRDPAGSVFRYRNRIFRTVHPEAFTELNAFLATRTARQALANRTLVSTRSVAPEEAPEAAFAGEAMHLVEHERIPFASYPFEWPAEMLHAAGSLTLDLAQSSLEEGFGIKDASPYNVLFRGSEPVFVDLLSFERREPRNSAWMAYAQFVRTFLLPLLAARRFRLPVHQTLAAHRDGLEPDQLYQWAGPLRRLTPPFLGLISIPHWLGGSRKETAALYHPKPAASQEQARFILSSLLKSCRRQLNALAPPGESDSVWSGYLDHKSLYSSAQLAAKEHFVTDALDLARPKRVLDVGANEGRFSLLAARYGASTVAIDIDPVCVGSIWRKAANENLDVLPLVVDLTRPTPALGWRNQETQSFLDRAKGSFDLVLMLAVIHHILVTERIPLDDLFRLVREITRDYVLIEFVAPDDPMFQRIVRGREHLYAHLTRQHFEQAARAHFEMVRSEKIEGLNRWLYLFRRSGRNRTI